jgi:hypothetical protein
MKVLALALLVALPSACASTEQNTGTDLGAFVLEEDIGPLVKPTAGHNWLQQLVGEWDVVSTTNMGPDADPWVVESSESTRTMGGLWTVGLAEGDFMGTPYQAKMTLGYDPAKDQYIGNWIDSIQTHLWAYTGELDESGKILILNTEGPSFSDPTKMDWYQERIEIINANKRTFQSFMKGENGEWQAFMQAEYTRRK